MEEIKMTTEGFEEQAKRLAIEVKASPLYQSYLEYKGFLENQPDLYVQVNEFRKKAFEIQSGHKYGYFNAYENLLRLNQEYETMLSEPVVQSFLDSELKVSKMLTSVMDGFSAEIGFDLDFLKEKHEG